MKKTIVYGLGTAYKKIISDYFNKNNQDYLITAVTDKKSPKNGLDLKYDFISRDNIQKKDFDIILVTSNKYYEEIKNELISSFEIEPEKIISLETVLSGYYARSFYCDLFTDKIGVEVGGPSQVFECIYSVAKRIDGVNFSPDTVWWKAGGNQYVSNSGHVLGDIIIADAVDLSGVKDSQYDFYISSNNLEHIANPMKAVFEALRVVKGGGLVCIVVPKKDTCFDHNRDFTSFSHILDDYKNNIQEDDLTHLSEILTKHDYSLDPACGGKLNFHKRGLKNAENRCLHHHVFSLDVLKSMISYFDSVQIISAGELCGDYFILCRKLK